MKKLLLSTTLILCSVQAFAKEPVETAFITAAINSKGIGREDIFTGGPLEEVADWSEPLTQSTTRLSDQCGVLSEIKLVRASRQNFVFFGVRNESKEPVTIDGNGVKAVFSGGRERILKSPPVQSQVEVKSQWYAWGFFAMPNKEDFLDRDNVQIEVPVIAAAGKRCTIHGLIKRNTAVAQEKATYIEVPSVMVSLGYIISKGMTPISATAFDNRNTNGIAFYFAGFPKINRGVFLGIDMQDLGEINPSDYYDASAYETARLLSFNMGPAFRGIYSKSFSGITNVGLSIGMLTAEGRGEKTNDSRLTMGLYASYMIDWRYYKGDISLDKSVKSTGLTVFAKYYPWLFDGNRADFGLVGVSIDVFRGGE